MSKRKPLRAACSIDGCGRLVEGRGLCSGHWLAARRAPGWTPTTWPPLAERFWAKVDRSGECWMWTGGRDRGGYGRLSIRGMGASRSRLAHRVAYRLVGGPIPDGLTIDHLCRNTLCVKVFPPLPDGTPDPRNHLEPVTNRVNILRGHGPSAVAARRGGCSNGHPYTAESSYVRPNGVRRCRQCRRDTQRIARIERAVQVLAP